jgi:hypothetical protein
VCRRRRRGYWYDHARDGPRSRDIFTMMFTFYAMMNPVKAILNVNAGNRRRIDSRCSAPRCVATPRFRLHGMRLCFRRNVP